MCRVDRGCVGGQDASNLPFKLITSRMLSEVVGFGGSVGVYDREECRDEQQGRDVGWRLLEGC